MPKSVRFIHVSELLSRSAAGSFPESWRISKNAMVHRFRTAWEVQRFWEIACLNARPVVTQTTKGCSERTQKPRVWLELFEGNDNSIVQSCRRNKKYPNSFLRVCHSTPYLEQYAWRNWEDVWLEQVKKRLSHDTSISTIRVGFLPIEWDL